MHAKTLIATALLQPAQLARFVNTIVNMLIVLGSISGFFSNLYNDLTAFALAMATFFFAWAALYFPLERHPRVQEAERAYIQDGAGEISAAQTPLSAVFGTRQLWAFALGKALTDPIWWFYLYWLPKFLAAEHDIRGTALIPYLTTVYIISDVGSIAGGYLSSALIKAGWSVNRARNNSSGTRSRPGCNTAWATGPWRLAGRKRRWW